MTAAIAISQLDFTYPDGDPVLRQLDLTVAAGARCLLVGANGSGKTTLLSLIAGKHMVPESTVRVLGRPAFYDTALVSRVSFLGGAFPLDVDIRVEEILARRPDVDPARRARLIEVLGVDLRWRMNRVSDGQRRRVQILLGLERPVELLLLDEVTTDLDVVARVDLLAFLRADAETRGTSILYATHILDGLEAWATHLAHLDGGRIRRMSAIGDLEELRAHASGPAPLLRLVERWLRPAAINTGA